MKHTPGKWEVYQQTDVVYVVTRIAEERHFIATVESQLDGINNDEKLKEQQANAYLLASAPELLEAARHLLIVTRPDEVFDARVRLINAINKADPPT